MGAGVIPFCKYNDRLLFLLTRSFTGRKAGFLNDFGGGCDPGEDYRQTAMREFVEETETLFFSTELSRAERTPARVQDQITLVEKLFENTLSQYPHWWCQRDPGKKSPPKDWRTFFIAMRYRDVEPLNEEWLADGNRRFSRRRELRWIEAEELLAIFRHQPERLWKRVRQLQGAEELIGEIRGVTHLSFPFAAH